ncbi:MAG: iron transporter [Ruminococcus sp.]|nr:iron transporter [Ruminococcus sp.]
MKKILAIICAAAMAVTATAALSGCANSDAGASKADTSASQKDDTSKAEDSKAEDTADDGADDAGFTEYPIFEDEQVGFMNVSAVFFQAVPMTAGATIKEQKAEDYDIHLEADISALENTLGYELGSWVPYLTVDYKVTDGKETKAEGTFMEMAASDGPHYGANIKLPDAGTYELTITIHSPADNDYLIHSDALTGPGGTFDDYFKNGEPLSVTKTWEYTGPVKV